MTQTSESLRDLTAVLQAIADEMQLIREALDEIREELSWANRNTPAAPPFRLTSMSADPTAPDWAERLNRFTPADLPEAASSQKPPPRTLFEP